MHDVCAEARLVCKERSAGSSMTTLLEQLWESKVPGTLDHVVVTWCTGTPCWLWARGGSVLSA